MEEGRILEWLCDEGDAVSAGQPLLVVETDKAAVEVPAEESGTLLRILAPVDATVTIGTPVAWIGAPHETVPDAEPTTADTGPESPSLTVSAGTSKKAEASGEAVLAVSASPAAKRLARVLGVDIAAVQAHVGPGNRVREADVQAFAERSEAEVAAAGPAEAGLPEFELLKPTPLQRTMAEHLTRAAAIPQSAAVANVELTELEALRGELLPGWEAVHGFRLTFTHVLAALVTRALVACPQLNASWTDEGIRLYRGVNLGVAMASSRGLVVPVVRDANTRDLAGIAAEIVRLQQAAERNRLAPQDLEGGTFTMTNVGMLGIAMSIPVLNPPQSGILGIGARQLQPALVDGELRNVATMAITLVADHRVVDGAASAAFLRELKTLIEQPRAVLA
jgi:pyruvate dehydrogenase E2 component (dihydrolipoamide acetyltransferase)